MKRKREARQQFCMRNLERAKERKKQDKLYGHDSARKQRAGWVMDRMVRRKWGEGESAARWRKRVRKVTKRLDE